MAWKHFSSRIFTGALVVACSLFGYNNLRDQAALREFGSHVQEMAEAGGGVLFVLRPADCLATAELAREVGDALQGRGVAVKGLVVRDGVDRDGIALVLESANQRFGHAPIRKRGAVLYLGRATGTPVVVGIGPTGGVRTMERLGGATPEDATALAQRLLRAVGH